MTRYKIQCSQFVLKLERKKNFFLFIRKRKVWQHESNDKLMMMAILVLRLRKRRKKKNIQKSIEI